MRSFLSFILIDLVVWGPRRKSMASFRSLKRMDSAPDALRSLIS